MRRMHLAWMRVEQIGADAWRPLQFDVPLLRWTVQADIAERDAAWNTAGDARARSAIWGLAGELLHWRKDRDQRPHIRRALGLLRRAWVAHCAGRKDLSKGEFAAAMLEWQHAGAAPQAAKAGEAFLSEQSRVILGNRAHRGKPEKLTQQIRKAIEANHNASNAEIAAIVGTSPASVSRRRKK